MDNRWRWTAIYNWNIHTLHFTELVLVEYQQIPGYFNTWYPRQKFVKMCKLPAQLLTIILVKHTIKYFSIILMDWILKLYLDPFQIIVLECILLADLSIFVFLYLANWEFFRFSNKIKDQIHLKEKNCKYISLEIKQHINDELPF